MPPQVFPKHPVTAPASLGGLRVSFYKRSPEAAPDIHFSLEIVMSDGSTRTREGDLSPFLSDQQISNAAAFLNAILSKAATEVLQQ